MKEILQSRLNQLPSLEERAVLKEILNGVFSGLIDYTDQELSAIKDRVFNDIEDEASKFDVFYQITSKDEFNPISSLYFPIDENDLSEENDLEILSSRIREDEQVTLTKVYLNCDFIKINRFLKTSQNRQFRGNLVTTQREIPIKVGVRPYTGYIQQLEQLYINFINNDMPWQTILHPYLYKFIEINLATKVDLAIDEQVIKVEWHLEEMDAYQKMDTVPLWNIKQFEVKNESFPVPAKDRVNFEHTINLEKHGLQHGYLLNVDKQNVLYVRKGLQDLTIISKDERVPKWKVFQFIQPSQEEAITLLNSNHQELFFTDRFAKRENHTVRSMCEISRIINGYVFMKNIALEHVEIVEEYTDTIETYEVNPFIKDNIRAEMNRTVMVLSFKVSQQSQTIRDEISFLVSEVQLHFPEFRCVGKII
ncbi:hypothetical protein RyT2_18350 [Pseudolactococcus yaeyamensis]